MGWGLEKLREELSPEEEKPKEERVAQALTGLRKLLVTLRVRKGNGQCTGPRKAQGRIEQRAPGGKRQP